MLSPIAYLTCELKGRDLDSRFLIAAHLAKLGYYSVVGDYWNLASSSLVAPKGCYLFKTANAIQAVAIEGCAGVGHKVVVADEEAVAQSEDFAHMTTDAKAVKFCDLYVTVSERHKRGILRHFPAAQGKISAVGSARFDILRAAKSERPHLKPYVLINTIFGAINSTWGDLETATDVYCRALNLDINDPSAKRQVDDRIAYERAALDQVRRLLERLIAEADLDIIIRPHPSERPDYWRDAYVGQPRVTVVDRSDPVPWIQNAKIMVHCDSTTGIEAAILKTPCVNLSAKPDWAARLVIPDANYTVHSGDQAADAVMAFLETGRLPAAARSVDELFPANGALKTAKKIAGLLPSPRRLTHFDWSQTVHTELQKDKFNVSPPEAAASAHMMSSIAGIKIAPLKRVAEFAYLVSPQL